MAASLVAYTNGLPDSRCSCGFAIPAEAEYCPGCGRPVTPEALARERAANALPLRREPETPEIVAPPVSFSNRAALRACYWNAALAAFFGNVIGNPLLAAFWSAAAGCFSVMAYVRRTGATVTFEQGCRLGAMTGAMVSALTVIVAGIAAFAAEDPGAQFRALPEQLREQGQTEQAEVVAQVVADPAALAVLVAFLLILLTVMTLALATIGGGLGARWLGRKNTRQ